ncbi:uncharacterized protein LOC119288596 [Triticum dicoccoides]|uniref:uncharacterized protein LOC119288596 n=1 Tax=Triticum dicoccoides TaxID=85692 RepID=UPI00188DCF51|nr:uncharacterized protein LOC119288596 [Triticum dicoccoides]
MTPLQTQPWSHGCRPLQLRRQDRGPPRPEMAGSAPARWLALSSASSPSRHYRVRHPCLRAAALFRSIAASIRWQTAASFNLVASSPCFVSSYMDPFALASFLRDQTRSGREEPRNCDLLPPVAMAPLPFFFSERQQLCIERTTTTRVGH